ncbi:hypothetical protein Q670_05680 [Alcanivorax sp. P2S70]|nr:hypothetical protein Q670_05680 [Alcanivorax sp. P2S70]
MEHDASRLVRRILPATPNLSSDIKWFFSE